MHKAFWLSFDLVLATLTGIVIVSHGATDPVIRAGLCSQGIPGN